MGDISNISPSAPRAVLPPLPNHLHTLTQRPFPDPPYLHTDLPIRPSPSLSSSVLSSDLSNSPDPSPSANPPPLVINCCGQLTLALQENNTLKRRRPFGQGQSSAAGPTLQQDHLAWFDTLPSSDREAIVRTAEVLNVPFAHLVVQRQPDTESQPKRPRLTADTSMAPLFSSSSTTQDRREKSPASRHGGPAGGPVDDPRSAPAVFSDGFSLAVAGSRLADCLVTLCPPCSPYDAQSGKEIASTVPLLIRHGNPY